MPEIRTAQDRRGGAGWWQTSDGRWNPPRPQPRIVDRSMTPDPEWAKAGWQRYDTEAMPQALR